MKNLYSILIIFVLSLGLNAQNVFTVTKTTDPNPFTHPYNNVDSLCDVDMYGTFQWAIRKTNDAVGASTIIFDIPGTGVKEIALNGYLPQIVNSVTIDATTQTGYIKGSPTVVINGYAKMNDGLNFYKADNSFVKGLGIKNFTKGIIIERSNNTRIYDCVINGMYISSNIQKYAIGIMFNECQNAEVYGNIIGMGLNALTQGVENFGIATFTNTTEINIGLQDIDKQNTITNCQKSGVYISFNTNQNKISGNVIFNNLKAITLVENANDFKKAPDSLIYYTDSNLLKGNAEPNDIIEIFGSTGDENANEYLTTLTADANGNWEANVTTTYDYFVANATDIIGNSSQLSNISSEEKSLSVTMCDTTEFAINISGYNLSDTITISLNIPNGFITVDSANASDTSAIIGINYDTLNTIFTITNLTSTSLSFNYYLTTDCELFNPSSSTEYTNDYTITFSGTTYNDTSIAYQLNSPWIIFDISQSQNLDYNYAISNVSFERRFYYKNTSANSFTGSIKFTDIVDATQAETVLFIENINVITNAASYAIEDIDVNDTSAVISVNINNLQQDDSIVFVETVHLDGCYDGFNNISFYHANYGCENSNLCKVIDDNLNTTAIYDPNDRPILEYKLLTTGYPTCWKDTTVRVIKITNTGGANADSVYIGFKSVNDFSIIDSSSFEIFTDSLFINPFPFNATFSNLYYTNYYANIAGELASGESLYLRYNEIINCIDSSVFESSYNQDFAIHWDGFPFVKLYHECYETPIIQYDIEEYDWRIWEHNYNLSQFFDNMVGSLDSGSAEWFKVQNSTRLFLDGTHYKKGFITDMDSSEIKVELILDPGLGLITDSIYMQSIQGIDTIRIYPYNIEYILGASPNSGNGDKIIAYFNFPDSFYVENNMTIPNGFVDLPTSYYDDFFENFTVQFKLHSFCEYIINGGNANIKQNFIFVPNINCNECSLPLSSVEDEIKIHCPGCILPGWNLDAFDITRENIGFADDDNNNFPDTFPYESTLADTNLANIKSMIIGDTINFKITGYTSDGEQYRFSNIGFDYKYSQLLIQGDFLNELNFIGASGYFTDSINTYDFIVNQSSLDINPPSFLTLNLSIDSLLSYGIDTNVFNRYWNGNTLTIDLKFIVKNNLINGTGFDPYYSIESLDALYNMSGVPYQGIEILPDAGEILQDDSAYFAHLQDVDSIAYLNYWCTGYQGRAKAIGVDFAYLSNLQNVKNYAYIFNPCYNLIETNIFTDVGRKFVTGTYANQGGNQTSWNSFAYEIRDFWMLDTITFTFPEFLEIDSIYFNTTQLTSDGSGGVTSYTYNPYYTNSIFNYDLTLPNNAIINNNSITIFPSANLAEITEYFSKDSLTFYDETKRYRINTVLKIKDYQNMPDSLFYDSCMVISHWSNFPGTVLGDTIITDTLLPFTVFTKPIVEFETQYANFAQNTVASDINWDIDIRPNLINTTNKTNYNVTRAENAFVYIYSESGNITVDSLLWRNITYPNNHVDSVGSINNIPLFGLDYIGNGYYPANYKEGNLTAYVSYDCSQASNLDTVIYMITGWNCYGYPDTLLADSVCYMDTTIIPIHIIEPGLQAVYSYDDTIDICQAAHYELLINSTTIADVDNININLIEAVNQEFTYIPNSATLTHISTSNTIQLEPDVNYNWNLDTISFMQNFSVDSILFQFDIQPSCGFENQDVQLIVSSENYCGRPLDTITVTHSYHYFQNLPKLDSLDILVLAENPTNCNDSSLISIIITNLGDSLTGEYNNVDVVLPTPYIYSSGDTYFSINSNIVNFEIPANINPLSNDTIQFYIIDTAFVDCNDSLNISACANVMEQYICNIDTCYNTLQSYNICDSDYFIINKPDISFIDSVIVQSCGNSTIEASLYNNSTVASDSIFVNYYCIDTTGSITNPCLFLTDTLIGIASNDTINFINQYDTLCTNCTEIMIVSTSNCICSNDTVYFDMSNTVSQPTLTSISSLSPCLYAGDTMQLTSNISNADTYLWSFDDGTTSNEQSPSHVFDDNGYSCVNLSVSNVCGTASLSQTIYINRDLCACISTYDISDTIYDGNSLITWDASTGLYSYLLVEGDVFVTENSTLEIKNVIVLFAPDGRIIVDRGSKLIITEGAVLTGLSTTYLPFDCDMMWQGVEAWGRTDSLSDNVEQALVYIHGGTIENAHIGILLGKRNMEATCDISTNPFDDDYSGAIVDAEGSMFYRNGIDIYYRKKTETDATLNNIKICEFKCPQSFGGYKLFDYHYKIPSTTNPYPNIHNPWAGNANQYGVSTNGILMERQEGIEIKDCKFAIHWNGIKAYDSKFKIFGTNDPYTYYNSPKSEMKNVVNGVNILNSTTNMYSCNIENTMFQKITGIVNLIGTAIKIEGGYNDSIFNNYFYNTIPDQTLYVNGIILKNTTAINLTENKFANIKYGIEEDGGVNGLIGAGGTDFKGNNFLNCNRSIYTKYNNNNLIISCNDHNPNGSGTSYSENWNNYGLGFINTSIEAPPATQTYTFVGLGNQGTLTKPAGNEYNYPSRKKLQSNTPNPYNYIYHDGNPIYNPDVAGTPITKTLATGNLYTNDHDECSDPAPYVPTYLPALDFLAYPFSELGNINNIIAEYKIKRDSILSIENNGETEYLIQQILNNNNQFLLRNTLIEHSPLSDTVLTLLIEEHALFPWFFKQVMIRNLPVSNKVYPDLYEYITYRFPWFFAYQINRLQGNNPFFETSTKYQRMINNEETKYSLLLNNIVSTLNNTVNNRPDDAIAVLEYDGSYLSKQILFGTYLDKKDYTMANQKLTELDETNIFNEDFVELNSIILALSEDNKTIYDVSLQDYEYIDELARVCPPYPAVYQARVIVEMLTGEQTSDCPIDDMQDRSLEFDMQDQDSENYFMPNLNLGENYPDPFNNYTTIPFELPESIKAQIIVKDVLGRTVNTYNIDYNQSDILINTNNWGKGSYFYSLVIEGEVLFTKKMILSR